MFRRQYGATLLGMLIIAAILGMAVYAGIRLVPLYLEYMAVARILDQTAKENRGATMSPLDLRVAMERRWRAESITRFEPNDLDIKKTGFGYIMRAKYRAEAPFVGNVSLVVDFDKSVDIR